MMELEAGREVKDGVREVGLRELDRNARRQRQGGSGGLGACRAVFMEALSCGLKQKRRPVTTPRPT